MSEEKLKSGLELDVSDFTKSITDANRGLRMLDSSFNASVSAIGDWTKSQDALAQKIESVSKKMELQNYILEERKKQYDAVVEAEGANSKGAEDALIKLNRAVTAYNKSNQELARYTEMQNKLADTTRSTKDILAEYDLKLKVHESSFKAVVAGMDDWTQSSEGLKARISSLTDMIETQRQKTAELRQTMKALDDGSEENARAFQEAQIAYNNSRATLKELRAELINMQDAQQNMGSSTKTTADVVSELDLQIKALKTGFEASVSGMDDWKSSNAAVGAQIMSLNKQIDLQKQKISALQTEYEKVAKEKGATSKEARELEIQLNQETKTLGEMQGELNRAGKETDDLGKESKKAEKDVKTFGDRLKDLGKGVAGVLKGVGSAIGNVAKTAAKGVGVMLAGAAGGAVMLGRAVINSFSELEQNLGGSEAVFGEFAARIQKIGEDAYRTMGVTQSQYLATANKMGALFQGSGIEVQRSMELTEQAMQRAADMASVMGIDMQMALDSVAGAAKGNFTMMDNLGVAMNATTIEAYAAGKGIEFVWAQATQAEKAEMAMQMFFEQTAQYAGNFEREATTTVSGSIGLLKAATSSWIAGLGNANADMTNLSKNVVDAFGAVKDNVVPVLKNVVSALPEATSALIDGAKQILPELLPVIITILMQVFEMIVGIMPELIPAGVEMITMIVTGIVQALPQLLAAGVMILQGLVGAIMDMAPTLMAAAPELITQFVNAILQLLPMILTVGVMILTALATGIIDMMPELVPVAVDLIMSLIDGLMNALPSIIKAGIAIIVGLVSGLSRMLPRLIPVAVQMIVMLIRGISDALPQLMKMIAELIPQVVIALIENLPLLIEAAIQLILALVDGLIAALPILIGYIPEIITAVFDAIIAALPMILEAGIELIKKLIEGLKAQFTAVVSAGREIVDKVISGLKENFSKLISGGKDLIAKVGEGIKQGWGSVTEWGKEVINKLWEGIKNNWSWLISQLKQKFSNFFATIFGGGGGDSGGGGGGTSPLNASDPVLEGGVSPITNNKTSGALFTPLKSGLLDIVLGAAQTQQDMKTSVSALLRPNQWFGAPDMGALQPAGAFAGAGYESTQKPVTIIINSMAPVDLEMLANKVVRKIKRG